MGAARNRRKQLETFLARQPYCIYCGGVSRATTRDHAPSRQLFHNKQWPEGFEFPSCDACNQATKHVEQVMALISRMYPDSSTEAERHELKRIFDAVRNNYPEVLDELESSREQIAKFRAAPWAQDVIRAHPGEAPVLSLRGPIVNKCARNFARKLFCALHYKEFGRIVPTQGGILWKWYANVQRLNNEMPDDLTNVIKRKSLTTRTKRDLSAQFSYTFDKATDAELTAYFATFRMSFAMLGIVEMDASRLEIADGVEILRPLIPRA